MINTVKNLLVKYKGIILYLVFGAATTVINIATYWLCYNKLGIANVPSDVIAWVIAVIFAFLTNKIWVFDSKSFETKVLFKELTSFVGCRLATGVMDVLIMYLAVDVFKSNGTLWKVISNCIVVVLNYVASKLIIFKDKSDK